MNEALSRLLTGGLTEFTAYAHTRGLTPGQLLDLVLAELAEQDAEASWPPPFELELRPAGASGSPMELDLVLLNIDRDLTSFAVDVTDFDPEGDGAVKLVAGELGPKLRELGWYFQYREDIGRIGAFASRTDEYEDVPDLPEELVLCRLTFDVVDEVSLRRVSIGGNHYRDGKTRHFTYHEFADAEYVPEAA